MLKQRNIDVVFPMTHLCVAKNSYDTLRGLIHQGQTTTARVGETPFWLAKNQNILFSEDFLWRKRRLYSKLLKRAYETNQMANNWWIEFWNNKKNRDGHEETLRVAEQKLGSLNVSLNPG